MSAHPVSFVAIDQTAAPPLRQRANARARAAAYKSANPRPCVQNAGKQGCQPADRRRLHEKRKRKSTLHTGECLESLWGRGREREREKPQSVNQPLHTSAKSIPAQKSSNKTDFYCRFFPCTAADRATVIRDTIAPPAKRKRHAKNLRICHCCCRVARQGFVRDIQLNFLKVIAGFSPTISCQCQSEKFTWITRDPLLRFDCFYGSRCRKVGVISLVYCYAAIYLGSLAICIKCTIRIVYLCAESFYMHFFASCAPTIWSSQGLVIPKKINLSFAMRDGLRKEWLVLWQHGMSGMC